MTITAVQTTMTTAPVNGEPGMLYDSSDQVDIIHRVASEAILPGVLVNYTGSACELPDSAGEVTGINRGLAILDPTKPTTVGYAIGDLVPIMVHGRAWIQAEAGQTIAANAMPYARHTANGGAQYGWRSDADTARAAVPNSMHMFSSATSGGMGVLQIATPQSGPVGPTT